MRILLLQLLGDNTVCWLARNPSEYSHPIRPTAAARNVDTRRLKPRFHVILCQKYWRNHLTVRAEIQTTLSQLSFRGACANYSVSEVTGEAPAAKALVPLVNNGVTSAYASPLCISDIIFSDVRYVDNREMAVLENPGGSAVWHHQLLYVHGHLKWLGIKLQKATFIA